MNPFSPKARRWIWLTFGLTVVLLIVIIVVYANESRAPKLHAGSSSPPATQLIDFCQDFASGGQYEVKSAPATERMGKEARAASPAVQSQWEVLMKAVGASSLATNVGQAEVDRATQAVLTVCRGGQPPPTQAPVLKFCEDYAASPVASDSSATLDAANATASPRVDLDELSKLESEAVDSPDSIQGPWEDLEKALSAHDLHGIDAARQEIRAACGLH